MVELFTAFGFAEGRRGCQPRFRLSPSRKLPTPVEVERSPKRPNPLSGITRRIVASPALIDDDPIFMGRVRVARIPCGVKPLDRIDRLLALRLPALRASACPESVYLSKPPSIWTSTSRRIQLYGRSRAGGNSRAFHSVGGRGTPVVTCLQSSRALRAFRPWLVTTASRNPRVVRFSTAATGDPFPRYCKKTFSMKRIGNRVVGNSAPEPGEMIRQELAASGFKEWPAEGF